MPSRRATRWPNWSEPNRTTGALWTTVNERDGLGDNLVPDYATHIVDGGFYGWPWVYWGNHPDPRFEDNERPAEQVSRVLTPVPKLMLISFGFSRTDTGISRCR